MPILPHKIVVRQSNVPRVPDYVDDASVTVVKVLMAFNASGSRNVLQHPVRLRFGVGNEMFDIRKCRCLFGMQKVRDQKSRPGIARPRVGNDKSVVWIDSKVPTRDILAESIFQNVFNAVERVSFPGASNYSVVGL